MSPSESSAVAAPPPALQSESSASQSSVAPGYTLPSVSSQSSRAYPPVHAAVEGECMSPSMSSAISGPPPAAQSVSSPSQSSSAPRYAVGIASSQSSIG